MPSIIPPIEPPGPVETSGTPRVPPHNGKPNLRSFAQITAAGQKSPSPGAFLEYGTNTPRHATPFDDAPGLFPRYIELRTYERMLRNDAQVRATIRACKIPVFGGEWYVDPASISQDDQDAAQLVSDCFVGAGTGLNRTWVSFLEDALRMLEYGSSVFELVWNIQDWAPPGPNRNTRNVVMLKKLAYRPPVSIIKFLYDSEGGPAGVIHRKTDPSYDAASANAIGPTASGEQSDIQIPIEKLLILTYDQYGGDLTGNSLLRTAYKHWYYKENFYKIDAVQKERHGIGVPKVKLPAGYDDADLAFAAELAQNIRTNERAYILEPPGWEITFEQVPTNLTNALASAEHHDVMIARNVLVQFINQGAIGSSGGSGGSSGGRATSATMYDLFLKSLRHIANMICESINSYVIPRLVDYNFQVKRYPELKVRRIGENRDYQQFSAAMRNLIDADAISVDKSTEQWIRSEMDMPQEVDWNDERINQSLIKPGVTIDDEGNPIPGTTPPSNGIPGRAPTGRLGKGPTQPQ